MLRKSACPFGQVQTKIYLPYSPFFKNSLARVIGLVLMLNPVPVYSELSSLLHISDILNDLNVERVATFQEVMFSKSVMN